MVEKTEKKKCKKNPPFFSFSHNTLSYTDLIVCVTVHMSTTQESFVDSVGQDQSAQNVQSEF